MALSILDFQTEMVVQFPTKKYQEGNSRVSADNSDANGVPYYFLINMGGGFVEGEQYQVTIDVNKDAHALVTTQTPTYVYKCERGQLTQQHTSITLEEIAIWSTWLMKSFPI